MPNEITFGSDVSEAFKRANPHLYPPRKKIEAGAARFDEGIARGQEARELHVPFAAWLFRETPCKYIHADTRSKSRLPAGWPDYTVLLPGGIVVFLEFKTVAGRLGDKQEEVITELLALGFPVLVTKSLKEAQSFVTERIQQP